MHKPEHERDSFRPIRQGRDWQSANARTFEGNEYASDRGFNRDYERNENQHFDRGYPSEADREQARGYQYNDADNGRLAAGRGMDAQRSWHADRSEDTSYMDHDTDRDSWRSNSTRPYNFNTSRSRDSYGNAAYNNQGLSGQTWAGTDRSDRMSFDAQRGMNDRTGARSSYGRDSYDTSYGTGYGSSYGSYGAGSDDRHGPGTSRFDSDRSTSSHFGKGPKGWKRSDERIKEEVSEALYRAHDIDASDIDVTVKEGTVTLSGTVDSREAKRAAETCVERLSGVEDVTNEIKVRKSEGLIGKDQTYIQGNSSSTQASGTSKSAKLS